MLMTNFKKNRKNPPSRILEWFKHFKSRGKDIEDV